eukprot:scaffold111215_cov17-Prasinocladus_malaysianus.AAC.3
MDNRHATLPLKITAGMILAACMLQASRCFTLHSASTFNPVGEAQKQLTRPNGILANQSEISRMKSVHDN